MFKKQNGKIPDIVPIAVLSGSLGSLYGKDIAEKIERWLQARMDSGVFILNAIKNRENFAIFD